ncbi:MAG: transcription elongation factor GreA [Candidatus Uhrbacteria bacterium GW2011_GWE2_45_35]|uniref:Transcription elongation factor GreA n=2 Tax=Candidatus Uhriibacteriota TaxID=1752732 RepID=A0A0G1JKE9_9BACT|nr:MAG: transcription elongation factor GreA [Candidatus Uhrbacteria bacterium GW2011_GWF2_44_350]KKU09094.1 MAG: transcription elongation factor GreA [Candidatus Uhrbacteria bacterium GW2011_GWE2_45_35]HBR80345.1 transcription elongation factor GreA [Candidatus Uhrbacteria bacterium]HCU31288.1 transcription elongation factor GreA [Candidatus Uhrbacteria bacterium]
MSTFVSTQGLEDLKNELENRKKVLRPEIAQKISSAKELGDLSENFEYHEAKDQQGQNESRVMELEDMLRNVVIVHSKTGDSTISLGCTFVAEKDGTKKNFQMVGSSEANPLEGKISNESPIGQAFLGSAVNETVKITTPGGEIKYKILEIK